MPSKEQTLMLYLQRHGASSSADLQSALGVSQATVSRVLAALSDQVLTLGKGRASRYALAQAIGAAAPEQSLWRVDEQGQVHQLGVLSFLFKDQMHVAAEGVSTVFNPTATSALPWYLSSLRAEGFLGRLQAQRLAPLGVGADPERWDTQAVLLAALHTDDAPGSLLLGDARQDSVQKPAVIPTQQAGAVLDALCADLARTLPAGSSAGGEQPKFLAQVEDGAHVLIKFSPPLGTPFGDRWSDLLQAEALSNTVLRRHGHAAAECEILSTSHRTYLLSKRFDRVGRNGRLHVVSVGAVHAAFVPGAYVHWAATAEALQRQGRLSAQDAASTAFLLQFGRLIGNTDMHAGNASLFVQGGTLAEIARGQFALAPAYDMLPMRWKPNPMVGQADYAPFVPDTRFAGPAVRAAALDYWQSLAALSTVSAELRHVAAAMCDAVSHP